MKDYSRRIVFIACLATAFGGGLIIGNAMPSVAPISRRAALELESDAAADSDVDVESLGFPYGLAQRCYVE